MKKLTEGEAIKIVTGSGGEISGKFIHAKSGLRGLKACSALDFLVNHCGYKSNLSTYKI